MKNQAAGLLCAGFFYMCQLSAVAAGMYDSGASATEIRIGNIASYTGPAQAYAVVARAEAAYFRMINDRGGINGRRIEFISADDASDPAQALPLAQRLVEKDQVLALFSTFGTDANLAIRGYANERKIPQLFVEASSALFDDPAHFPWTMGFYATYRNEGQAYARYVLGHRPDARIGLLYEHSAAGQEFQQGLRDGLGEQASRLIVSETSYVAGSPNVDAQIDTLRRSGADTFMNFTLGATASNAIRHAHDVGWQPLQFIPNASLSVSAFLEPAGLAKATGIISSARSKSWWHANAASDPEVRDFLDWMAHYDPGISPRDQLSVAGYERAEALVAVIRQCGDDLTRANLMAQAASLDLTIGMLRPGIRIHTAPNDYQPIKQLFLIRFDGHEWTALEAISGARP
jgi:branched-chain amino acid transport system substrate-binding protein